MILLIGIIASLVIKAQSSDFFNYQAIIRDAGGNAKANTSVSIFVEILQGSISGTVSFSETHPKTTNSVGLVNLQIGSISTTEFSAIDWSNTPFFIRISVDGTVMGTSQLLSVPFALYSKKAGNYVETDPIFFAHPSFGISTSDISQWSLAYGWGNHAGLYKSISYLPDWNELTNNPISTNTPLNDQLLKYSSASNKWENWTPNYITAEIDGSETNEIQTLSLNANQLTISGTGGNSVSFTNWDTDKTDDVTSATPSNGDMLYYNGTSWVSIPKGTTGQVLTMGATGAPEWQNSIQIPPAQTLAPTFNVATNPVTVTFNGIVNPNNLPTTVTFEYGTTTSYGSSKVASQSPVIGNTDVNVSGELTNLTPGTLYHFRVKTDNALGTSYGDDMSFTLLGIGLSWEGGIIFYLDNSGQHGLVAATADQGITSWGCEGLSIPGADGIIIGAGNQNTTDILNGCATAGIAARLCREYSGGGFNDWFLPSKDELGLMYTKLKQAGLGGFSLVNYWSSSESSIDNAFRQNFGTGTSATNPKSTSHNVRAARAF